MGFSMSNFSMSCQLKEDCILIIEVKVLELKERIVFTSSKWSSFMGQADERFREITLKCSDGCCTKFRHRRLRQTTPDRHSSRFWSTRRRRSGSTARRRDSWHRSRSGSTPPPRRRPSVRPRATTVQACLLFAGSAVPVVVFLHQSLHWMSLWPSWMESRQLAERKRQCHDTCEDFDQQKL